MATLSTSKMNKARHKQGWFSQQESETKKKRIEEEKNLKPKIPKEIRKKLTERDVQVLSKALENVTVTQSGMLRTSNFFVPNPEFKKSFGEGMKSLQEIPATLKEMTETMKRVLLEVTQIKQIMGR